VLIISISIIKSIELAFGRPDCLSSWSIAGSGDFNGDGKTDICQNTSGARLIWLMNGTVRSSVVNLPTVSQSWSILGTGDFNRNGKTDILWQQTSGARVVWLMNGTVLSSVATVATVDTAWSIRNY
jgi:hypothetical protein